MSVSRQQPFQFLWFAWLASTLRRRYKSTGWYEVLRLVTHRVDDVIHSELNRARAFLERLLAFVEILPEIADIVVVISDQLKVAMLVGHSPELRRPLPVGRLHIERIDVKKTVKDRMLDVEPHQLSLRNCSFEVVAQDIQLFRTVQELFCAEIIRHNETASPDVFAEIGDFLLIQNQETRLR